MKMIKNCCFIMGTALLAAALFLVILNVQEDRTGGEQAQAVLAALKEEMTISESAAPGVYDDCYQPGVMYTHVEAPKTAEVDGNGYIGVISVPSLQLELPVMEEWSDTGLKTSPCRYQGSIRTNDLIIAGHNYKTHFGKISRLSVGADIVFTDVQGRQYDYRVCEIEHISGTDIEAMTQGSNENWNLTLFTCTLNGQSRVTVRAERI